MSTDAFEDFCLSVSTLDYARMSQAMDPLVKLMEATDRVHLVAPGTDLQVLHRRHPRGESGGEQQYPRR